MEYGAPRGPDERRAAAEERARRRAERGEPAEDAPLGGPDRSESEEQRIDEEIVRRSPEGRPMSRHYGGSDVYGRRRMFAAAAAVALAFVLFMLLFGC